MPEKKISNYILLEKLSNIHEKVDKIEAHLEKLNGKVAKHESHCARQEEVNKVFASHITKDEVESAKMKDKLSSIGEKVSYILGGGAVLAWVFEILK